MYILKGNNNFFIPARYSWKMMKKLWPIIVRLSHVKKFSLQQIIQDVKKKVENNFSSISLIEVSNQTSKDAAVSLWHSLPPTEITIGTKMCEDFCQTNIKLYHDLIEELCQLLNDEAL